MPINWTKKLESQNAEYNFSQHKSRICKYMSLLANYHGYLSKYRLKYILLNMVVQFFWKTCHCTIVYFKSTLPHNILNVSVWARYESKLGMSTLVWGGLY